MNEIRSKSRLPLLTPGRLVVLVVALGVGFIATVLVPGLQLAGDLVERIAALKFVGETQHYPALIRASLDSIRDRLGSHSYLQDAVTQLHDAALQLDTALPVLNAMRPAGTHAARLSRLWESERSALKPLLGFQGVPYEDHESTGPELNDSGRQLERDVTVAIRITRHALPSIEAELAAMGNELKSSSAQSATRLRWVLVAGLAMAAVLGLVVTLLLLARKRQDAVLRDARQQTVDILRTVKDGLFLIDEKMVIGSAYSNSLEAMFQRRDFAGLPFESLLKDLVAEKTLTTAVKYVRILWSERTNQKLVASINPLGEVEVHIDAGRGKVETRYLQFEFHRVRVDGKITHVLVAVSDVSARVDLARQLQAAQSQSQFQVDTLLGILHIEPAQLASFLTDSTAAMESINAILREPAREERAFRNKIETLFRPVHAVKGEAAALGLTSIESRAHAFEEGLNALRDKPGLSGDDFLPLVIQLDDLLIHLHSIDELVSRVSQLQFESVDAAHTVSDVLSGGLQPRGILPSDLTMMLQQLVDRVAADNHKEARLLCLGFETVPVAYRRMVKDISIQAVRNALVHGIETPANRLAAGKPQEGRLRLEFQPIGEKGYKFTLEDDGRGLATERIKAIGVARGLITADQAATLPLKQVYSLLFQSGFSTLSQATTDAGRGVGLNVIAELVLEVGGRIGLATLAGQYTRFSLTLPAVTLAEDALMA